MAGRALSFRISLIIAVAVVVATGINTGRALATDSTTAPKNKGLYITPIRQFPTQNAGTTKQATITVGNYTEDPMVVSFSVKKFSVADYSYDYTFDTATDNPISFDTEQVRLKSNESKSIPFRISLPADSKPGGQYYTLFATGSGETGTARQQIQATSQIYLTVNGTLTRKGGLSDSSIDHFVFRPRIPFSLDISNDGNIHYFSFINATVSGWFSGKVTSSETHLLLPDKTRHFESSVKTPFWPGLYKVSYGYSTDFQQPVTRVSHVLYVPPWSMAAGVILVWIGWAIVHRRRRSRRGAQKPKAPDDADDPTHTQS